MLACMCVILMNVKYALKALLHTIYMLCIAVKLTLSLLCFHSHLNSTDYCSVSRAETGFTFFFYTNMQQPAKTSLSFIIRSGMPDSILIAFLLLNDLSGSVTSDFHCRALC